MGQRESKAFVHGCNATKKRKSLSDEINSTTSLATHAFSAVQASRFTLRACGTVVPLRPLLSASTIPLVVSAT